MRHKFDEIGIQFKLFDAFIDNSSSYDGKGKCSICDKENVATFKFNELLHTCKSCGETNSIYINNPSAINCRKCKTQIYHNEKENFDRACFSCLNSGLAMITKVTELGRISWEHTLTGLTDGEPGLKHSDFEIIPKENGWSCAKIPIDIMYELLKTPDYSTWQGIYWLFCCQQAMVYQGNWGENDFIEKSTDGIGKKFFENIIMDVIPGLWEGTIGDSNNYCVFKCDKCDEYRGHWDMA